MEANPPPVLVLSSIMLGCSSLLAAGLGGKCMQGWGSWVQTYIRRVLMVAGGMVRGVRKRNLFKSDLRIRANIRWGVHNGPNNEK